MWGSSFLAAIPPDSARPPVLPSLRPSLLRPSLLRPSLTHTIILSSDLFLPSHTIISSSHTHTHSCHLTSHTQHNYLISSHTHTQLVISSSDTHTHTLLLISHIHSQLHLFALLVTPHIRSGRRSIQSLQKGLRRALSPLVPLAAFRVAGAVSRASSRACGARCRRWCRLLSSWQAQYPEPPGAAARVVAAGCPRGRRSIQSLQKGLRRPEPPEGAAARVVAAGAAGCRPRGRRSTQSLQKGLRRALSPLVPLAACRVAGAVARASMKGLRRALSPPVPLAAAAFRVAGAVSRASRRGCGARCRRWCRWLPSAWQAQYPEPPKGAAARVVAAGAAGCLPRGRRSTQRLQKGLRRALSPLVPLAAVRVAGAVPRASRRGCGARCRRWLPSAWQAQYPEPPEGAAARVVAAGCLPRGRRYAAARRSKSAV